MTKFSFKEYNWSEIRKVVTSVDKELGKVIDEWNPGKEYTFIELSYPFGAHILDINKGGFQIPLLSGHTVPLSDPTVPSSLRNQLSYSSLPLGVLAQGGGVEVYHKLEDHVFSLAYLTEGFNLGIWEAFGPPAPYSVVSGARSLLMGPKIADKEQHQKLKNHFNIRQSAPRNLFDQWDIFVEMAKHLKNPWEIKVLFLNKKWLEPQKNNIGWLNFYTYLQKKAWEHTEYVRAKSVFAVTWKEFFNMLQKKGERFDPYLMETARHLVFMCQGVLPAFAPVGKNQLHGPIQFLMQSYEDIYCLKNYVPTMLAPVHFGRTFKQWNPVYYSLQNPTLLVSVPKVKTSSSAVEDMRSLKSLMEFFTEKSLSGCIKTENGSLLKAIKIDYFHSEMYSYGGIEPSSTLPEGDPNLLYTPGNKNSREFAETGSFFRCCLRISLADSKKIK